MAENYWISFRIDNDATYEQRYTAFRAAVDNNTIGFWAETTSFYLASSNLSIDAFAKSVCAALSSSKDKLVIRCLAKDDSRYFGKVDRLETLKQHLPKVKKLG